MFVKRPGRALAIAFVRRRCSERHNVQRIRVRCPGSSKSRRDTREVASLVRDQHWAGARTTKTFSSGPTKLLRGDHPANPAAGDKRSAGAEHPASRTQATLDALTGLSNRGRFDEFLAEQFAAATLSGKPLSLVLLDIDYFKLINDRYGHPTGTWCSRPWRQFRRRSAPRMWRPFMAGKVYASYRARLGRSRPTLPNNATRVQSQRIVFGKSKDEVTASFGVASLRTERPPMKNAHLIQAADLALYAAKNSGRNCVRVFSNKAVSKPVAA